MTNILKPKNPNPNIILTYNKYASLKTSLISKFRPRDQGRFFRRSVQLGRALLKFSYNKMRP